MKLRGLLVLALIFAALMPTAAHADVFYTFNSQAPGLVVAPLYFYSSNTSVIAGKVASMPQYSQYPPNVFVFNVTSTGAAYAYLQVPIVAINQSMPVQVSLLLYGNATQITSSEATVEFLENGQVQYSFPVARMNNTAYHVIEGAIYATPGSEANFSIELSVNKAPPFQLLVSAVKIGGADLYISPHDVELINPLTGLLYSLQPGLPVTIIAEYPYSLAAPAGAAQLGPNAIAVQAESGLVYIPQGATLVEAKVGNLSFTQLASVSNKIYVWQSMKGLLPVTLSITDLTTLFGAGSEVIIYLGSEPISSGYLSSASTYSFFAPPGVYTVRIIGKDGATYQQQISVSPSSYDISIFIQRIVVSAPSNGKIVMYGAGFAQNRSSIIAYYIDPTQSTTYVKATLFVQNATGIYPVASASADSSLLYAVFSSINSTEQYVVQFFAETPTGNMTYGPAPVGMQPVFSSVPSLPVSFLGLNYLLPNPNAWVYLLSASIMVITAVLFGAKYSKIGIIAVSFEGIAFAASGWLPVPVAVFMIFALLAFLGLMADRAQQF